MVTGQALAGDGGFCSPEGIFEERGGVFEEVVMDEEFQFAAAISGVGGFAKFGYADDGLVLFRYEDICEAEGLFESVHQFWEDGEESRGLDVSGREELRP
jgi:hypothetical protein